MYSSFGFQPTATLLVWCWSRRSRANSESESRWTPIHLPTTTPNVANLKEYIKEYPAWLGAGAQTYVDVSSINVYMSPSEIEHDTTRDVGHLTISMLGTPLQDEQALSADLRLIVDFPYFTIHCEVRGGDWESSFIVEISGRSTVNQLKDAIKNKDLELANVSPTRLRISELKTANDPTEPSASQILDDDSLKAMFDQTPLSQNPRIVVDCLDETVPQPPSYATYLSARSDDPITRARIEFLVAAAQEKLQPSDAAAAPSPTGSELLRGGKHAEIDETLLHPVFSQFLQDALDVSNYFCGDDLDFEDLAEGNKSYSTEDEMAESVFTDFHNSGIPFTRVKKAGASINGYMSTKGHVYVIAKVQIKPILSDQSPEISSDGLAYYQESTKETAIKFPRSALPCLLLTVTASEMWLTCATWNLRLMKPSLITSDDNNRHNFMSAFQDAVASLKQYYDDLEETPLTTPLSPLPHLFPYPTTYTWSYDQCSRKRFQYTKRLDDKKLFFLGVDEDGRQLWIRFVSSSYPSLAHDLCVSWKCAPALRGSEKLSDERFMVVMDVPDGFDPVSALVDSESIPSTLSEAIAEKEGELSKAGYVGAYMFALKFEDRGMVVSKDGKQFMITDLGGIAMTMQAAMQMGYGWGRAPY